MIGFRTGRWTALAFAAWAVDFAAMYALVTFACSRPALGWITTAGCAAAALAALVAALRADQAAGDANDDLEASRLGRDVAAVTALLSLVAILWLGIAVLSPLTCEPEA